MGFKKHLRHIRNHLRLRKLMDKYLRMIKLYLVYNIKRGM